MFVLDNKIKATSSYLDDVFATKAINMHAKKMTVNDIYESWPDSFKFLFQHAIKMHGGTVGIYNDMGYELPSMDRKSNIEKTYVVLQ